MQPEYTQRDDRRFGVRFTATAMISSLPVGVGLAIAFVLRVSVPLVLLIFGVTLIVPLTILSTCFRWTKCPSCGQRIRVRWNGPEYRRGGMLRYSCDRCRIVWLTHLYPGSDV